VAELADEDEQTAADTIEESVPSIDALVEQAQASRRQEPPLEERFSAISSDVIQADFFHGDEKEAPQVQVPEPIWNLEPEEAAPPSTVNEARNRKTRILIAGIVAVCAAFALVMWLVAQLQGSSKAAPEEIALPPTVPRHGSPDLRKEEPKRSPLREAVQPAPANTEAIDAQALYRAGRLGEAEAAYRALAAARPDDEVAHVNLASVLIDRGMPDEARQILERFVQTRPDSAAAQLSLAILLHQKGELTRAKGAYERFLQEAPEGHPQVAKVRNILNTF
jgi:tetratricopeptide (TPR) repeat protein